MVLYAIGHLNGINLNSLAGRPEMTSTQFLALDTIPLTGVLVR
jgi:hypothetical protein